MRHESSWPDGNVHFLPHSRVKGREISCWVTTWNSKGCRCPSPLVKGLHGPTQKLKDANMKALFDCTEVWIAYLLRWAEALILKFVTVVGPLLCFHRTVHRPSTRVIEETLHAVGESEAYEKAPTPYEFLNVNVTQVSHWACWRKFDFLLSLGSWCSQCCNRK